MGGVFRSIFYRNSGMYLALISVEFNSERINNTDRENVC